MMIQWKLANQMYLIFNMLKLQCLYIDGKNSMICTRYNSEKSPVLKLVTKCEDIIFCFRY